MSFEFGGNDFGTAGSQICRMDGVSESRNSIVRELLAVRDELAGVGLAFYARVFALKVPLARQ